MSDDQDKDFIAAPSPTDDVTDLPPHVARSEGNAAQAAEQALPQHIAEMPEKPPRARVEDAVDPDEESAGEKLSRKRDYLDGFLKKKPESAGETGAGGALQEAVIALALILKEFRFEPTPGLNPWPVQKLTVQAQNGLPMRVVRR